MAKREAVDPSETTTVREGSGRVLTEAAPDEDPAMAEVAPTAVRVPATATVEELSTKHGTPDWVMAALKVRFKWGIGQVVPEDEFTKAVEAFLTMPLGKPASAPTDEAKKGS